MMDRPPLAAQRSAQLLFHLDAAYTLARYLVRDEHDAQDVVQEAMLRALKYVDGFAGGDIRAWLFSIVRNCAMDWHRTHRIERNAVGIDDEVLAAEGGADGRAIRVSEQERITRAVESLPVEFREVIVLREIEELSYKEISEIIGAPIGTVMSRLSRARRQLALLLGDRAQEAI
jgi:RNA polymerase sigma-70 factor (ECF subfamily)